MGRTSAIVAVVVSLSAAGMLASCRLGYELTQSDQLSDGAPGSTNTNGNESLTATGSGTGGSGAASATSTATELSGLGGAASASTNHGDSASSGIAGYSVDTGSAGADGSDTGDGSDGTDGTDTDGTDGTDGTNGTDGTDTTDGAGGTGGSGTDSGSGGSGPVTPLDHCQELRKLREPPVLDGELEAGMYLQHASFVGWNGEVDAPPTGNSLRYSAGWYDTGVYFYIEITDPERNPAPSNDHVWRGDSIEIYVDHDAVYPEPETYDNPGTFQFVVGAPGTESDPGTRGDVYAIFELERSWTATSWVSLPTASGYRVEAFIAAADLGLSSWTLAADTSIGFDLGQNVSFPLGETGDQGNRVGQWFLKIREPFSGNVTDYPYVASDVFCTATLLGP